MSIVRGPVSPRLMMRLPFSTAMMGGHANAILGALVRTRMARQWLRKRPIPRFFRFFDNARVLLTGYRHAAATSSRERIRKGGRAIRKAPEPLSRPSPYSKPGP